MGFFDKFKQKISGVTEALSFDRLKEGLSKTRESLVGKLRSVLFFGRKIDAQLLSEIEEILITSDVGVTTTEKIISRLTDRVRKDNIQDAGLILDVLKEEIAAMVAQSPSAQNDATFAIDETQKPHVIMLIGVNGVGKTTTIGKLAHNYKRAGRSVLIGAADTFRAAANEQLEVWAQRAGVDIVQQQHGADPAAVAYDTLAAAKARGTDVVTGGTGASGGQNVEADEKIVLLSEKISALVAEAEQAGTQGNVEQAQGLMKLCDQLREERDNLRR